MPVGRIVRHSPLYLYLKLYSLSVLVSLFASRPITGRLSGQTLRQIDKIREAAEDALIRRKSEKVQKALVEGRKKLDKVTKDRVKQFLDSFPNHTYPNNEFFNFHSNRQKVQFIPTIPQTKELSTLTTKHNVLHPFPYAIKTFALDADSRFPAFPLTGIGQKISRVLRRWGRRLNDMNRVKRDVGKDQEDCKRYPEIKSNAFVRCSNQLHKKEVQFIQKRAERIASDRDLLCRMGLPSSGLHQSVHPDDIPRVAIGGSGGGYRATFGFLASLQGLYASKVFESAFWIAGVSGSCWTIASLYTVANRNPDTLLQHYKHVAEEGLHPMSRGALDVVARSPKGVYFLLAPLLAKLRDGNVGIGIMDMYATLTTSYQLLSRSPHARPRLSRSTFAFSKVWQTAGMEEAKSPMPIFTAVRVKPSKRQKVTININSAAHDDDDDDQKIQSITKSPSPSVMKKEDFFSKTAFEWWEMNPLEVGSSDEEVWVPTWSYGRAFVSGKSVSKAPEISLSLLLGQATSAPAGPLTGYISALLATIPRGTLMSKSLARLNDFVRHKRWENRWGNPIRGADEPNILYGFGNRNQNDHQSWEGKGRLKLMDSGMSNNLPNHIFCSTSRWADIVLAFDQSSDVQTGAALKRLDEFAKERKIVLVLANELMDSSEEQGTHDENSSAESIKKRFQGKYCQVFRAWKVDDEQGKMSIFQPGLKDNNDARPSFEAEMYLIYCPLLPNACQPDFDPVTASFSTSYNLVWKPEEVETLTRTARANTVDYVVPTLRKVYNQMYQEKKRRRIDKERIDG